MNITAPEYEQRRSIFQCCDWINAQLTLLERAPNFEELYFERSKKEPLIKKLLEEVIPLAYFGLYFWRPWRTIFITCSASDQAYDTELELRDPRTEQTLYVEVTTTETPESVLRRQKLARDGFAHFTGKVWRDGRTIHTEGEMVDVYEECEQILSVAFERFQAKAIKETDRRTTILVYVNTYRTFPTSLRTQLIERTQRYVTANDPNISGIYYCYSPDLGVEGLHRRQNGYWE